MKILGPIFSSSLFLVMIAGGFAVVLYLKKKEVTNKKVASTLNNKSIQNGKALKNTSSFVQDSLRQKAVDRKKTSKHRSHKIFMMNPHPSDDDCILTNKYNITQRLKRYPFSKAAKIVAVSFRYMDRRRDFLLNDSVKIFDDGVVTKVPDSLLSRNTSGIKYESGLHIENKGLNYSSIIEVKVLDSKQIKKLTNIIYNTTVQKATNYAHPNYSCYAPRNALIFYDRNQKVYDYLKVCFECKRYESLSKKIRVGSDCNQVYDLLKQFFIGLGIKFGTIKKD